MQRRKGFQLGGLLTDGRSWRWRVLALVLLVVNLAACGTRKEAAGPEAPPDATYVVRGEVARLPAASGAGGAGEIWIRHEAIPGFKDLDGKVVGMDSMTMPFSVTAAGAASLAGIAGGDRVELRLEMRWRGSATPAAVTVLSKLPAGTRLDFDPPDEEAPAQPTAR